ncbi:MAG TPA: hydantoinase/oxoprolinase family protein [Chloroflexota bacterium]|nr:hydantoinase/oxoprolinase family protein [Chloroflexota bacterium]
MSTGASGPQPPSRALRLAVDIGGTFTDAAVFDEATGQLTLGKWSSTPRDLVEGILRALDQAGADLARANLLLHGSTVVVNAILQRRGARTALITTRGFRDVYEIGRINRPEAFNLFFRKHVPLVPRSLRFEVTERLDAEGEVLVPFDAAEAEAVARRLVELGIESVAVVFLHAYRNPAHELRMRDVLARVAPELFVTLSHELSREYREYERTSTTAANAFVGPLVQRYLDHLDAALRARGFSGPLLLMQSNGGLCDVATARRQCIQLLESGPAGGVAGAEALCAALDIPNAIGFDMGGTTAKAAVIEGGMARLADDFFIGGYNEGLAIRIPAIDIHEVGTGGGSLARVDEAGGIHVGPESAGAEPGPVCYGRGGVEPTVTDANLVLGRLDAASFIGGERPLDADAARRALAERVARPLGLPTEVAASGIVRIAVANMANAVRAVTTARGLDPRDFTLIAYGGGGPLHASLLARELAVPRVLVPTAPAVFAAVGMLRADLRRDYVLTHVVRLSTADLAELEALWTELETRGRQEIERFGVELLGITVRRSADMRYVRQEHAVTVQLPPHLRDEEDRALVKRLFDAAHEQRYSHSAPEEECELVSLRLTVIGAVRKPPLERRAASSGPPPLVEGGARDGGPPPRGYREVYVEGSGWQRWPAYARAALPPGATLEGPALVDEPGTTTVVEPGDRLRVDPYGNLCLDIASPSWSPP